MSLSEFPELSVREVEVLQYIIQEFIISASPVGSKNLVKRQRLDLSSATVRNVMNSLEKKGYLTHPHTSAGRVPTDLGYRFYVNSIANLHELSRGDWDLIREWEQKMSPNLDDNFHQTARILAKIANLLAVVISPKLSDVVLRRLKMVSLSSNRILIVLELESAVAKTVTVEVEDEITTEEIERLTPILNERLSGLALSEINRNITEIVADIEGKGESGLIRVFVDSADSIFEEHITKRFHFGGVEYMPMHPEFNDLRQYRSIIELVEDENLIIHLFEQRKTENQTVKISIGSENLIQQAEQCSVVSADFEVGTSRGTIGLVGPTRMDYPRLAALVEQMATRISKTGITIR